MTAAGRPVRFTDGVLDAIAEHICSVPPERGAVLLGFADIAHFALVDSHGAYSGVSWDISAELGEAVKGLESAHVGTFVGTLHSHPRGVVDPSSTDIESTATMLRLNPHLESLVVAVVTEGTPERDHHLPVGKRHRISLHRVQLEHDRPVVLPIRGEAIAVSAGLADAAVDFTSGITVRDWRARGEAAIAHAPRVSGWRGRATMFAGVGGDDRLALAVPADYPLAGPVLLGHGARGLETRPSPWDPSRPPRRQLRNLVRAGLAASPAGRLDRAVPVVGDLGAARVLIAGAGSVGSRIAEDLVRAGVGHIRVIDPETVEAPNLSRTVYVAADLGELKVEALARHLRAIDPAVEVDPLPGAIGEADLPAVLADVDLVIGATDDMREQLLLAHHAYAAGRPMVTCAMYAGAGAGEVIVSVPALGTPCVACSLGDGTSIRQYRPEADYGLKGRLKAEPGLGASIHVVTSTAALMALGILAGPGSSLASFVAGSIATGRTLAMISTRPRWGFFPDVFGDSGHQLAPQSVWIRVERTAGCVVCGEAASRVAPPDHAFGADLAGILAGLREDAGFAVATDDAADAAAADAAAPTDDEGDRDGLTRQARRRLRRERRRGRRQQRRTDRLRRRLVRRRAKRAASLRKRADRAVETVEPAATLEPVP